MITVNIQKCPCQESTSSESFLQTKWNQIKDFVHTHKKEIAVALLIVGLAIVAFSVGNIFGAALSMYSPVLDGYQHMKNAQALHLIAKSAFSLIGGIGMMTGAVALAKK